MLRNVLAVVLGVVVAVIVIMLIQTIGHAVYPPPPVLDIADREAMAQYIDTLPVGALLFVLVAWLAGTLVGGLLACFIADDRPGVYSAIVGGMVLFATVFTLLQIPHPLWFSLASVIAIVCTSILAGMIGKRFKPTDDAT
jgi:hypothetical protein